MIFVPFLHKRFIQKLSPYQRFHIISHSNSHFSKLLFLQTIHTQVNNGRVEFFDRLLQRCLSFSESFNLEQPVKQIHAQITLTSSLFSAFLSARLITVYARLSLLNDAQKVFDTSPKNCFSNSIFWNSIIRANSSFSSYKSTLRLYCRMRELNFQPDGFGFPLIIRACAMKGDVRLCKIVHCHVLVMGLVKNLHVANELVGMYGEIGWMEAALKVFDGMPLRSQVSWNTILSGFAKNLDCEGAFAMFHRMENEGWEPNSVTWTSLISSFARRGHSDKTWEFYVLMRDRGVDPTAESIAVVISECPGSDLNVPLKGEILHGHVIRAGFEKYMFVRNALISMYGRSCAVEKAESLFSGLESKSIVSWNALISAYAQSGLCDEAFSLFLRLENSDDILPVKPNVVSWTAVINGFAAKGRYIETLELFRRMQFAQVLANAVTTVSVLSVCAELSALPLGREIHAHAIRTLMNSSTLVENGLINMYMKCGSLLSGHLVFEGMVFRDITSWNTMITGYGMHGVGDNALNFFYRLLDARIKPDEVTFVAILSACSHSGLVTEGRNLFDQMTKEFRIEPQVEHYACMIDLLGRAGLLQEATDVLKNMPMEPNAPVWGALLNSCKMHKNTDVAEETAARIFKLSSEVTGSYMLLSNLYAESGKWDDSAKVRLSARTRGLKKITGQSWIEVKNKVRSFSVGMVVNLEMEEIYGTLNSLNLQMVMDNYVSKEMYWQEVEYVD
ncbi:hypothetical protein ACJIZ3_003026 [Penstemon smallii]|uniref:Pentatricopeptide repeat-containing protein n=1 Tax=Penstemon smallii TaxID=265156 RepID=A0ABD3UAZ1_9LAMI